MQSIIQTTADGSHTLYMPEIEESCHSIHGAMQESAYIFIEYGLKTCLRNDISVFEVGFGTGLNALLTAMEANRTKQRIHYTAIELYPVTLQNVKLLNYPKLIANSCDFFDRIHQAIWETDIEINPFFVLHKVNADFTTYTPSGMYDAVYFDAFSPEKQPEIWTEVCFAKIAAHCNPGAVLITYCAKGTVRRILQKVGFRIERLPGPPGKREILRGEKVNK